MKFLNEDRTQELINKIKSDYATTSAMSTALDGKVDKVSGKGLSKNDYDDTAKGIVDGVTNALADKVDKINGKGLSTEDYTTTEKTKLSGISNNATKTASSATNGHIEIDDVDTTVYDDTAVQTAIENIEDELSTDYATVEGNPLNFSTLSAQNAKSTILSVEPIQDLHGYDKPWVGGAGKNLLPMTVDEIKAANTSGSWSGNVYNVNNGKFTILTDNDDNVIGIKVSDTFSAVSTLRVGDAPNNSNVGYILNGTPTDLRIQITDGVNSSLNINNYSGDSNYTGGRWTLTPYVLLVMSQNTSGNNKVFYPMIRLSTETDATFQPYSNICPISGRTEIGILGTNGKESTDPDYEVSNDLTISIGQTVYGGTLDVENGVLVVDKARQKISDLTWTSATGNYAKFTTNSLVGVIKGSDTEKVVISELYKSEDNTTVPANQNHIYANNGGQVKIWDDAYASSDVSAWLTARGDSYMCYELATPITIQLTPNQISLLEGVNNISTTGDKITLTYRDGKVATLGDLLEVEKKIPSATAQHNYSIEEQKVGKWIDGKPLYEKTITVSSSSISGSENTIAHSISNVDNIFFVEGCMMRSGNLSLPLVTYHTASSWACSIYNLTRTNFTLYLGLDEQSRVQTIYITLRYTKTTDV